MKIVLRDDWDLTEPDSITGTIYFETPERSFPCHNYTDFPLRCFSDWLEKTMGFINRYKQHRSYSGDFLFFDGPYIISINHKPRSADLSLSFFDSVGIKEEQICGDNRISKALVDVKAFVEMILISGREIVKISTCYGIPVKGIEKKLSILDTFLSMNW